ncbi:dTDP-4-dehydrorhamnose 3,5-epimerase [Amphibacillus marinus]|uniref:dTDP-4-dehydrorhamnose 3,5-epimerase n=1 Tax=Amphibacillus marinus TaxID=872970 RepID=A0A1H8L9M8_9BACI|nr:NAD-dependent epimerase/dehydratase family protein [Amphibacillus marinus]SEO01769.1 dTDP-4-dehydrorhamnose 3,5-epimerase [Amphibacillus marinus]
MKGKVIVTGATGFLGEYVIKELIHNNYDVIAIGRNEAQLTHLKNTHSVETLALELTNKTDMHQLWPKDADSCLHCAGLSTVYGRYQAFYEANVLATKYAIEASIANGVKRFVFVSTPSIYAKRQDQFNIKETDSEDYSEHNTYLNHYIKSKSAAEHLLKQYQNQIEVVVIRPRGLFGVGDTSLFPRLMEVNQKIGVPLFRKGAGNVIDITCVENVAHALRLSLEAADIDQHTFNITNDEPIAFKVVIERIFSLLGEEVKFKQLNETVIYQLANCLEAVHYLLRLKQEPLLTKYTVNTLAYSQTLDITLAKEKLGYAPIMTVDQGLKHYIDTIKKN